MAVTDPPPTWPIEPTIWYIVLYYPNNASGTAPSTYSGLMRSYEEAVTYAKSLITNAGNIGVCAISQVTGAIVYPSIPWVAF